MREVDNEDYQLPAHVGPPLIEWNCTTHRSIAVFAVEAASVTVLIPCVIFVTLQLAVEALLGVMMKNKFVAVTLSEWVIVVVTVEMTAPVVVKRYGLAIVR